MKEERDMYKVLIRTQDGVQHSSDSDFTIPFGSEYAIGIKHAAPRTAVVNIWLDGNLITGSGLVVPKFRTVWLERPTEGSNRNFKFVSDDSQDAADAGKNDIANTLKGRIRVEFRLEKEKPKLPTTLYRHQPIERDYEKHTLRGGVTGQSAICYDSAAYAEGCSGVTVGGSISSQSFDYVDMEVDQRVVAVVEFTLRGHSTRKPELNYCSGCACQLNPLSNLCPGCRCRVR